MSLRPLAHAVTCAALALLLCATSGPAHAQGAARPGEPAPVADFFRHADFVDMVASPNGRAIAALGKGKGGRVGLVILDLADPTRSKNVASFTDIDVARVLWVNDDRLVFAVTDHHLPYGDQLGSGLFAVDREGSAVPRMLIQREWKSVTEATNIVDRALTPDHRLQRVLRDGSADVLVRRHQYGADRQFLGSTLLRLDTRSGQASTLSLGEPDHVVAHAVDARGVARAVVTYWAYKEALHWRAAADQPWTRVQESAAFTGSGAPRPIWVDPADRLYLVGRAEAGNDTTSLLQVDMRSPARAAVPVLSLDGYDFTGALLTDSRGTVQGVRYLSDARATHWFDAGMAQLQKRVDALLPDTNNLLDCDECTAPASVLVKSTSDRQPTVFRLFDVKTGALQPLAASRPWVKPATMASRDMVRIPARDGLQIPVHITRPKGQQGPAPMVVLVHGGPWVRGGEWRWDAPSQFLTSRGYVVIEPEFRGSTGYGDKLYRAGFKQWGLAMQDDVADATRWAIKQGHADPARVCIAGASYGGYATLMGLIRDPELYRCGFQWVGVTDIGLMYSIHWSDLSTNWQNHGMPVLIGDRVKDAEQLAATSPIRLAARLKQPLLMAYGGLDARVPIEHGLQMRAALRPHNARVEWVDYPSEGHGWMSQANDIDFWSRVERFLERHLKTAP